MKLEENELFGVTVDGDGKPRQSEFFSRSWTLVESFADAAAKKGLGYLPAGAGFVASVFYDWSRKNGFELLHKPPSYGDSIIHFPENSHPTQFVTPSTPETHSLTIKINSSSHSSRPSCTQLDLETKSKVEALFKRIGVNEKEAEQVINALQETQGQLDLVGQKVDQLVKWKRQTETLQGIASCSDFLLQLGALTHCEPLQKFASVSKAVVIGIQAGTELIAGIASGAAAGSMLGPIGAIGGAILGIIGSLFGNSGPDVNEMILNQLGNLSEQLSDLHKSMNENFKNIYKAHTVILDTMINGFNQIHQQLTQLQQQGGSLQVEMQNNFAKIQMTLKLMLTLLQQGNEIIILKDLESVCAEADNWLLGNFDGNPELRVPQISNTLANWSLVHTSNKLLTGVAFFEAKPDQHDLASFLSEINASKINTILGYLAHYAMQFTPDSSLLAQDVINPVIWLRAVEKYIAFKKEFIPLDNDIENQQLDLILKKGSGVTGFIEKIIKNEDLWESLLTNYNNNLEEIADLIESYKKCYSFNVNPKLRIDIAKALNFHFFEAPDELIKAFESNTIGIIKFQGDIAVNEVLKGLSLSLNNQQPILEALKQRQILPAEFLCAESLKLIEFSVKQSGNIGGYNFVNPDDRTVFLPSDEISPNGIKPSKKGGAYLYAERKLAGVAENWQITIQINCKPSINYKQATKAELDKKDLQLNFAASWFHDGKDGWDLHTFDLHGEDWGTYTGSRKNLRRNPSGDYLEDFQWCFSDETLKKYKEQLHKFAVSYWNGPNMRPINLVGSKSLEASTISKVIDDFYLFHRKIIADNLFLGQESLAVQSPESQRILAELAKKLESLYLSIQFLKLYAFLIGKDINNFEDALNLITPQKIKAQLSHYSKNTTDLKDELIAAIWFKKDNALNYKKIKRLPEKYNLFHPSNLVLSGNAKLNSYKLWKQLVKHNFPTFTQFVNLQEYKAQRAIHRVEFQNQETYQWLETLFSKKFRAARFWINDDTLPLTAEDYRKHYQTIYAWIENNSREPAVIGLLPNMQKNINLTKLQDLATQQLLTLKLNRGWERNIWLLMWLGNTLGDCKFDMTKHAINYAMWLEGVSALIRMIFNPNFAILEQTGINLTHHIKALKNAMNGGLDLKQIILTLARSKKLFEHLFNGYLHDVLGELHGFIKEKIQEGSVTSKSANVFHLLQNAIYKGSSDKLFDLLETYYVCIVAYFDMLGIASDNPENPFSILMERNELLNYLSSDNESSNSILERLTIYCKKIQLIFDNVLEIVDNLQNFFNLYHDLKTHFIRQDSSNCLVIDGAKYGSYLTQAQIKLIDQFLSFTLQEGARRDKEVINSVKINNIDLSNGEFLQVLFEVLLKTPTIKSMAPLRNLWVKMPI